MKGNLLFWYRQIKKSKTCQLPVFYQCCGAKLCCGQKKSFQLPEPNPALTLIAISQGKPHS